MIQLSRSNVQYGKGKLDKEVRVQLGEDELEAEEEMMDTMLCTQARLKDVTYSARDIPR